VSEAKTEVELKIISGTDRPDSNAIRVSRYLKRQYEQLGAGVEIVDLKEFPLPAVKGGPYGKKNKPVSDFIRPILQADALVIITPEYNGGYPGILKLMIDYLPFPEAFEKLPICFVGESAGAFGALRAVEQLQLVVGYRNAYLFPERVFINRVKQNFDEKEGIKDEFQQELLMTQVENFLEYVRQLKDQGLIRARLEGE
jgi:NAD(P)H-dependent FMN reductase